MNDYEKELYDYMEDWLANGNDSEHRGTSWGMYKGCLTEDAGAAITRVVDGQQAVDLFQENPEGTFDVILMDVMMPVMDGLTATRTIRALDRPDAKTIPIIAMTANAFEKDAQRCYEAGMNIHLPKPLEINRLLEAIIRCSNKR